MAITVPPDPYYLGHAVRRHDPQQLGESQPRRPVRRGAPRGGPRPRAGREHRPHFGHVPGASTRRPRLSPGDIQNIQALYGTPAPDPNGSNNTFATATPISSPPLYLGPTPLVAYGDRATLSDTNFFSVQPPLLYSRGR